MITSMTCTINGVRCRRSTKVSKEAVLALESALKAHPNADTSDGDVTHHFSEGLYARELRIPAGTTLVGHIHLQGQINFLMSGTIRVTTDTGVETLTAPRIIVSEPGTKRAGHALTDTVWVTVLATSETDLAVMAEQVLAKGFEDPRLKLKQEALCLGQQ